MLSHFTCAQHFASLWTISTSSSVQGDSPGKNTGVGCCALLQGIFLTQGSNPCGFSTTITPTPTSMDRSSRQKINTETQDLNDRLEQMCLIDIYRTFHPKAGEYTFFSSAHKTLFTIDYILDHKSSLGKFKKTGYSE